MILGEERILSHIMVTSLVHFYHKLQSFHWYVQTHAKLEET